jgi:hypothetical protein
MEIKNFVKIYDEILPYPSISSIIRFLNIVKFEEAKILGHDKPLVEFNVRRTWVYPLNPENESLTNVHWANLFHNIFLEKIKQYVKDTKALDCPFKTIIDIAVLKYENTGFYNWHTDHAASVPRTFSCIFLLNNDYEGGNLCFRNPDGSGEWEVEIKPNRMIVWPSNFLYPHTVKPVTKGTRYSVVAWAL